MPNYARGNAAKKVVSAQPFYVICCVRALNSCDLQLITMILLVVFREWDYY